jgi:hypothetical protein
LPRPRSWTRRVELAFLGVPLLIAIAFFTLVICS